jgi:hypothetical protein
MYENVHMCIFKCYWNLPLNMALIFETNCTLFTCLPNLRVCMTYTSFILNQMYIMLMMGSTIVIFFFQSLACHVQKTVNLPLPFSYSSPHKFFLFYAFFSHLSSVIPSMWSFILFTFLIYVTDL